MVFDIGEKMPVSIPIPYARTYTADLSGATLKLVRCEKCHVEYVYRMERIGSGSGTSLLFLENKAAQDRATQQAANGLRDLLWRECDPVPCPDCGWYQEAMIQAMRRDYCRWMQNTGLVLLVVSVMSLIIAYFAYLGSLQHKQNPRYPTPPPWFIPLSLIACGVIGVAGAGLLVAKANLSAHYDPNATDVKTRIALGRLRALLKGELEKKPDRWLSASESEEHRAREFLKTIDNPPIGGDQVREDQVPPAVPPPENPLNRLPF
jgi:hypothetical protein